MEQPWKGMRWVQGFIWLKKILVILDTVRLELIVLSPTNSIQTELVFVLIAENSVGLLSLRDIKLN